MATMSRNRLYRSPGIDGIRLALMIIEAFTPVFYGCYKNNFKKMTHVLTAAIIME